VQIGPRIRFDKHTLGNLAKNLSPALAFTPVGALGALALSTAGDLSRGKNIGESLKGGLKNAAIGSGAKMGLNAAKGALSHLGGSGVSAAVPNAATATHGGLTLSSVPNLTSITQQAVDPRSILEKAGSVGGKILGFAEEHPNATAGALSAVSNLSTSGARNRIANAQADLLEKQAGETEYDFQRRKERDAAYAPLWGTLGSAYGQSPVAGNPYLPTGA
jgi:hypothetical protein